MEHLWSQAGATGKEGVDGSSPSEGSAKAPEIERFSFSPTCSESNVRWEDLVDEPTRDERLRHFVRE
jgi:hypothetical protein